MTKQKLISEIAEKVDISQKDIRKVLEILFIEIGDSLIEGEKVELRGFGVFKTKERKERLGRNPKTGKTVSIPPRKVVIFKPGSTLKKKVGSGRRTL